MDLIPFNDRAAEAGKRLNQMKRLFASCRLCARECRAKRLRGETGECGLDCRLLVSSSHLHPGEEPVISGYSGSGTVFFSGCNLACLFCQNYPISQLKTGICESVKQVAERFIKIQELRAHNLNIVTPTPQLKGIFEALILAWKDGLSLPIAYNCGGYESVEALQILDGLVDIYLTDFKYGNDKVGKVSGIPDYFTKASAAIKEMQRQVGELQIDDRGIAVQGLIIRHLILPEGQSATTEVMRFLKDEIGAGVYISLMSQYYPSYKARSHPALKRHIDRGEYREARDIMKKLGFENGWVQPSP